MARDVMEAGGVMEVVDLGLVQIDSTYQRRLMVHHRNIIKRFDARACDPLKVARRLDGSMWVIDGQQRRQALMTLGYTHWRALVIESTGPEMEAYLFQIFGGGKGTVKQLSVFDVFKAQLASKDPVAVQMNNAVTKYGMRWTVEGHNGKYPCLRGIKPIYQLVKGNGPAAFDKALHTLTTAWPEAPESTSTFIIVPLTLFWLYFPGADFKRLVDRLKGSPALHYQQYVQMVVNDRRIKGGDWRKTALDYFVTKYNKGLRNRLEVADRLSEMPIPDQQAV